MTHVCLLEYMWVRLLSTCLFQPDEDQSNPGRNVVFQNENFAGAEEADIVTVESATKL